MTTHINLQSHLWTKASSGTPKYWPLTTGGRYWQVYL